MPGVPIVLVGTKLDMREDPETIKKLKEKDMEPVTYEMGVQMKNEIQAVYYGECSAKTQKGLKEVFNASIESVMRPAKPATQNSGKKKGCLVL